MGLNNRSGFNIDRVFDVINIILNLIFVVLLGIFFISLCHLLFTICI